MEDRDRKGITRVFSEPQGCPRLHRKTLSEKNKMKYENKKDIIQKSH